MIQDTVHRWSVEDDWKLVCLRQMDRTWQDVSASFDGISAEGVAMRYNSIAEVYNDQMLDKYAYHYQR